MDRLRLPFTPIVPFPRQDMFLRAEAPELAIAAGSGATGKSTMLLAGAAEFADVPGYAALILRRHMADLMLPGGLHSRSAQWFANHGEFNAVDRKWTFPGGGTITMLGVPDEPEVDFEVWAQQKFGGANYQYVAFDDAQEWPDNHLYRWLFSRLRKPPEGMTRDEIVEQYGEAEDGMTLLDVPLRMRCSFLLSPDEDEPGRAWLMERFIDPATSQAPMWPMTYIDNPAIDANEYERVAKLAGLPHFG